MDIIDLRSDTVTRPTPEMRKAMAEAVVGDDVYGEDPTVNRLQELAAERMGKEAALFVPSGTMGNMIAILAQCNRGDEAIMGSLGHTFFYEGGGVAALGGIQPNTIANQPDGSLDLDAIRLAIRDDDPHYPRSRLIILENTQNLCGGVPLSVEYTRAVGALAHGRGLLLHIDGARIFHAAAALRVDVKELVAPADTVMFCLSKGLCAPVGSMVCGSKEFIHQAIRVRKQLGGGMRQAGILAAAGIIALEKMTLRLDEDHARARRLAAGLQGLEGLVVETATPATNMVFANLTDRYPGSLADAVAAFSECGIKIDTAGPRRIRLVTHYWVNDEAVDKTIETFRAILGECE